MAAASLVGLGGREVREEVGIERRRRGAREDGRHRLYENSTFAS